MHSGTRRLFRLTPLLLIGCGQGADAPASQAQAKPRSVLLITFDTTRADALGHSGDAEGRTPTLDALAARGRHFARAQAPAPLTLPTHSTILTGLLPPEHGVRVNGRTALPDGLTTLPELAAAEGLATAAFVSAAVLEARFGLDQGFDYYGDDLGASQATQVAALSRPAEAVTEEALAWFDSHSDEAFCVWLHYFDPHAPYEAPGKQGTGAAAYYAEVTHADAQLARVLANLENRGRLDETLIVFTSDHGEALGQHGEETHGSLVHQATMHVPLLFVGPGIAPQAAAVKGTVGLDALLPTVAEFMGWELPPEVKAQSLGPLLGTSATQTPSTSPVYSESEYARTNFGWTSLVALVDGDWKWTRGAHSELFDLAQDPDELIDLTEAQPAQAERMAAMWRDFEAQLVLRDAAQLGPDPALQAMLEGLGYISPSSGGAVNPDPFDFEGVDPRARMGVMEDYSLAIGFGQMGRFSEMARLARRAVEAEPEAATLRFLLGDALLLLGRAPEAAEQLEACVALDPRYAEAHIKLAQAQMLQGLDEPALEHLDVALTRSPRHLDARRHRAALHWRQGAHDSALEDFRELVRLSPRAHADRISLALALRATGHGSEMVETLEEALTLDPQTPELAGFLAWQLATHPDSGVHDGERALHWAEHLVALVGASPDALESLAAASARAEQYERAVQSIDQALAALAADAPAARGKSLEQQRALYVSGIPITEE